MKTNHDGPPAVQSIHQPVIGAISVGKGSLMDVTLACGHVRRTPIHSSPIPDIMVCPSCMVEANRAAYIQAKGW